MSQSPEAPKQPPKSGSTFPSSVPAHMIKKEKKPGPPLFPIVLGILVVGALLAAWQLQGRTEKPPATTGAAPAASAPATPPAATEEDVKALRSEVEALTKRLDAMPKPQPAPDLAPIQSKVDEAAKSAEKVDAVAKKVDDLDGRLGNADKAIESLRGDVASLRDQLAKKPEPAAEGAASTPSGDEVMNQGMAQFQQGKFAEARDSFRKLETSHPDDARVWYYAALANGFATGKWDGETQRLVTKGVEREKAGTPKTADIDAAFKSLTEARGKKWLDAYRAQAK
jgi:hypothetical protein